MNGVPPNSQPLGHILSEDIELNEISDELSQVIMKSRTALSIVIVGATTQEDGQATPTSPTAPIALQGQDVQRLALRGSSTNARQHRRGELGQSE